MLQEVELHNRLMLVRGSPRTSQSLSFIPKIKNKKMSICRLLVAAAAFAASALPLVSAVAHESDCPYCDRAIAQDTAAQDHETVLRYGKKRIVYKCVYCVVSEAKTEYSKGDLSIAAPSEKKGAPVIIKRTDGKWSAPASAVFVADLPMKHKTCGVTARAFTSKSAANSYIKARKLSTSPMTLAKLIAAAK